MAGTVAGIAARVVLGFGGQRGHVRVDAEPQPAGRRQRAIVGKQSDRRGAMARARREASGWRPCRAASSPRTRAHSRRRPAGQQRDRRHVPPQPYASPVLRQEPYVHRSDGHGEEEHQKGQPLRPEPASRRSASRSSLCGFSWAGRSPWTAGSFRATGPRRPSCVAAAGHDVAKADNVASGDAVLFTALRKDGRHPTALDEHLAAALDIAPEGGLAPAAASPRPPRPSAAPLVAGVAQPVGRPLVRVHVASQEGAVGHRRRGAPGSDTSSGGGMGGGIEAKASGGERSGGGVPLAWRRGNLPARCGSAGWPVRTRRTTASCADYRTAAFGSPIRHPRALRAAAR